MKQTRKPVPQILRKDYLADCYRKARAIARSPGGCQLDAFMGIASVATNGKCLGSPQHVSIIKSRLEDFFITFSEK
jgi:hypothetical protein